MQTTASQQLRHIPNKAQGFCKKTPVEIDQDIIKQIDIATAENADIWTSSDFNRREYVHSFFQYPAMMVPVVQKKLVDIIISVNPQIKNVIDPFMGSATTIIACMENGLNCVGQDINPLAVLIAKVRTGPYLINSLKKKSKELLLKIDKDNTDAVEVNFKGINKWFKPNLQLELSKLVRAIRSENKLEIRRFYWVILAEVVRLSSNDRTSTFKLHVRSEDDINKRNISAIQMFENHLEKSIIDYESYSNSLKEKNQIIKGKYRANIDILLNNSMQSIYSKHNKPIYELLVTSPPYGDNKTTVTYGQHSYLPLQWIDLKDIDNTVTYEYLKTTSEIDSKSLGGVLSKIDNEKLIELFEKSPTLKKTYELVREKDSNKVDKIAAFLLDLNKTLDNIFNVMKDNSYQIWTLGNRRVADIEIPNDRIIIELVENKGGKLIKRLERNILNKRMALRNKDSALMCKEDILIFRKIG